MVLSDGPINEMQATFSTVQWSMFKISIWAEWMSLISRTFLNTWSWLVVEPTPLKNMLIKLDHETPNKGTKQQKSLKNHFSGHGSWQTPPLSSLLEAEAGAIVGIDCQEKSLTTSSASWSRRERRNGTGSCVFGLAFGSSFWGEKIPVAKDPKNGWYIWVFPKIGGKPPKWMVKIMEIPIEMDDLEGKPTIFENLHIYLGLIFMINVDKYTKTLNVWGYGMSSLTHTHITKMFFLNFSVETSATVSLNHQLGTDFERFGSWWIDCQLGFSDFGKTFEK